MKEPFPKQYLDDAIETFRGYKTLADGALAQTTDEELFRAIDDESNSIAVIMKHIAGNMISRWTDFLTSDGEKPDRNRDLEFVVDAQTTREDITAYWERGWQALFSALEPLRVEDFEKTITIRGEPHSIVQAINRQLTHYAYHVGQLVFLAKHFRSDAWQSLSVPRNRSAEFNAYMTSTSGETGNRMDEAAKFAASLQSKIAKEPKQ
jgi:hypothetical protein